MPVYGPIPQLKYFKLMVGRQAAHFENSAACIYSPLAPLSRAFNADNTMAPAMFSLSNGGQWRLYLDLLGGTSRSMRTIDRKQPAIKEA